MDLYLITPPQNRGDELPLVRHFLQQGLHRLHVRKPGYTDEDYRAYIQAVPSIFHSRLVLHGAAGLLPEFPSVGIHLRSAGRHDAALLQQLRRLKPASLSGSFHAWEEIMENAIPFDYVFISPLFDSISKQGYGAGIDPAGNARLKQWASQQKKRLPRIVALGGVDARGIPLLQEYGFDGAALLGAIWEAADPVAAYEAIQSPTPGS